MSLLGILDISKSALMASQAALSVSSNNIANANTPGYSKEDIILQIATPAQSSTGVVGRGVTVAGIRRSYDQFLQSQLLGQTQNQGSSSSLDSTWAQIEQAFNDTQGFGLSSSLSDFFNAWQDVASAPNSLPQRSALLQKASTLVTKAQNMENGILDTLKSTDASITDSVRQINILATGIAKLNEQITQQEAGASGKESANDLRNQRDVALGELSKLIGFTSYEDANGALTITVGMRDLVAGVRTNQLSTITNASGNKDLVLDGINITSSIQKGQIGGLIAARDDIQTNVLTNFRSLIATVTLQVNAQHAAGFGLDNTTNNVFFNPLTLPTTNSSAAAAITAPNVIGFAALTLDEYTVSFNAAGTTYTVNNRQTGALVTAGAYTSGNPISFNGISFNISGVVTNTDTFTIGSPLPTAISNFGVAVTDPKKVAASSTLAGVPGDNSNAISIAQLAHAVAGNLGNMTFSDYYGSLVSKIGTEKSAAADNLTFDNNLLADIQTRRDSISGVSLDEEAANLMKYQRAYEAGARMISVADELMQTVLNLR